jgi:hypothetical protein
MSLYASAPMCQNLRFSVFGFLTRLGGFWGSLVIIDNRSVPGRHGDDEGRMRIFGLPRKRAVCRDFSSVDGGLLFIPLNRIRRREVDICHKLLYCCK